VKEEQIDMSIAPRRGTRKYRRNARLTLADGCLVATDRHGRSSSVPLDGSKTAPSWAVTRPDHKGKRTEMAILDGNGDAFVIAEHGDWDGFERIDLLDAAGLKMGSRLAEDVPRLRSDGRVVLDSTWWRWSPVVGPVSFAVGMLSGGDVVPRWIGFPLVLAGFLYLMAALASGAFSRPRVGKGYEAEMALISGDPRALDAYLEERRGRLRAAEEAPPEEHDQGAKGDGGR
jgi:hypothetical protein